jgi:hypothetical protein
LADNPQVSAVNSRLSVQKRSGRGDESHGVEEMTAAGGLHPATGEDSLTKVHLASSIYNDKGRSRTPAAPYPETTRTGA